MSLMSLVRWIGAVLIGWTLVAIGLGASGSGGLDREAMAPIATGSRPVEAMPTSWPMVKGFDVIDRIDGTKTPIRLPEGDRWSNVSISPYPGPDGELEAVGRWVDLGRDEFSGWAVFRPDDGSVLCRVATEIIPTGRPCWVPGFRRTILYSAADGRLYRCRLTSEGEPRADGRHPVYASGRVDPSDPVDWEAAPLGQGEPLLSDPSWSTDPRLRRWVFVSLMTLDRRGDRCLYGGTRIWWVELSDDARRIVAAGPLTDPGADWTLAARIHQRFPNVAVGPDGESRLVFLERRDGEVTWRLRATALEFDPRTGRPRVGDRPADPFANPDEPLQGAPLLLSNDGATVYGLSPSGGLAARTSSPRR